MPTPTVRLNRVVAVLELERSAAALALLQAFDEAERERVEPYFSALPAKCHQRAGALNDARQALRRAAALCDNAAVQSTLEQRLGRLENVALAELAVLPVA